MVNATLNILQWRPHPVHLYKCMVEKVIALKMKKIDQWTRKLGKPSQLLEFESNLETPVGFRLLNRIGQIVFWKEKTLSCTDI